MPCYYRANSIAEDTGRFWQCCFAETTKIFLQSCLHNKIVKEKQPHRQIILPEQAPHGTPLKGKITLAKGLAAPAADRSAFYICLHVLRAQSQPKRKQCVSALISAQRLLRQIILPGQSFLQPLPQTLPLLKALRVRPWFRSGNIQFLL